MISTAGLNRSENDPCDVTWPKARRSGGVYGNSFNCLHSVRVGCAHLEHIAAVSSLKRSSQASKGRIEYVVIPHSFLGGWAQSYPNLVIFDLQARAPGDESLENIAGWLPVSASELPGLLKWLPPESRVVFSAAGAIRRLDSEIEDVLLQSNIETVFFCEETATCPLPISFGKGTTTRSRNT